MAREIVSKSHIKSLNLGNTAWCTKNKRWMVMDVDRENYITKVAK